MAPHRGTEEHLFYETNIDPLLRYMHVTGVGACGIVEIDKKDYKVITSDENVCDINIETRWDS